jgi:serine/threonine-protein kinase
MSKERDRPPLSTEIPPPESELDLHPSGCWTSGLEVPRWHKTADAAAGDGLAIGQMLSGRYRIERELGEGGMGVVYLVSDQQVAGEIFAVKVLKEPLDPRALQQLREEVRQTRKLSHPNIVDMHSVNVDGKRLYVLMEYLEGKSLNTLLDEEFGRGMSFSHAWPIIEDVGAALSYAHDHNVIHSDLKPANVLLTTSGKTKLLDFGIARVSRGPLLHKRSGSRALTPAYASCEMLKGEEADRRDDIYSFACVIYEMLSGDRPFGELNALEARHVGTRVPPLGMLSQAQNEALAQALAFDRAARTPSVEQLLAGLATDKAPGGRRNAVLVPAVIATLAVLGFAYLALDKLWISRRSVVDQTVASEAQRANPRAVATPVTFNPPPHSIAVLPFVNMSGDKEQEYFSDGLSEELLDDLSRINELQVAARTSAFSFKGKDTDIGTIARKLNVGTVLEGSVRRSVHRVRVTAQLIDAVTGYHLWSESYERDLGDVLKLQTEIASAVASALRVTLLRDVATEMKVGGTRSPAAYDAYLRSASGYWQATSASDSESVRAGYQEAVRLDPNFALAYAELSITFTAYARFFAHGNSVGDYIRQARAPALKAVALAPDLAEGHMALSFVHAMSLDFTRANDEFQRAMALAPGNARVLRDYGEFAVQMGRTDAGIAAARRAAALDPLNVNSYGYLGSALLSARRYDEALAAYQDGLLLRAKDPKGGLADVGQLIYYALGDFEKMRAVCEGVGAAIEDLQEDCLALAYHKLGREADAETALARFKASAGNAGAYDYARVYAQWGNTPKALEWLETALKLRDPQLIRLKTEPLLDPLRQEPRFNAIERELKFPP